MIGAAAAILIAAVTTTPSPAASPSAGPPAPRTLPPAVVLKRYAAALAALREPRVLTFDYTLDQSGARTLAQTHRVFRSGSDERDETLTVDGARLKPPKVRVFRGRRNRYTVAALAPRPSDYAFAFVGARKDAHHYDYVFRVLPKAPRGFAVTDITLDGVRFLPTAITFTTRANAGSGAILFGRNARWWVPYFASARATVAASESSERLSFYTYRFPPSLPASTFGRALAPPRARKPRVPGAPSSGADVPARPTAPER